MLSHGGIDRQAYPLFGRDGTKDGASIEVIEIKLSGNKARDRARSRAREARERDQHRSGESGEQRFALLRAQTPHPAGLGDADLLHGPAGLYLADARE